MTRAALPGLVLTVAIVVAAAAAPLVPFDPLAQDAPTRLAGPDAIHLLGRDAFGRDVLARVVYAGRVSLVVAFGSVTFAALLGLTLGLLAGYRRGALEQVLMRVVDVQMSFPSLLSGLVVLAVLGAGLDRMILAIGIVLSPAFARAVHGTTLSLRSRDFVEAARSIGASSLRIAARHILPNLFGEVVVLGAVLSASAIRIEASLSFIGLGVSPPTPTWGNMIRDGAPYLLSAPWLSIFPGLAMLLAVLGVNLIADSMASPALSSPLRSSPSVARN